jgi:hypothetical protein
MPGHTFQEWIGPAPLQRVLRGAGIVNVVARALLPAS